MYLFNKKRDMSRLKAAAITVAAVLSFVAVDYIGCALRAARILAGE